MLYIFLVLICISFYIIFGYGTATLVRKINKTAPKSIGVILIVIALGGFDEPNNEDNET